MEKTFYKKCPNCGTISGFILESKKIWKNKEYFCQDCGKDSRLIRWKRSNENEYNNMLKERKMSRYDK